MTREMRQDRDRLEAGLHDLAASSPRGASPELELNLKDAFRRHHAQRRRALRIRIGLLCFCLAVLAGSLLLRKLPVNKAANRTTMTRTIPPQEVTYSTNASASKIRRPAAKRVLRDRNSSTSTDAFVALPSLAMIPAGDELRVVRLEMPGEDLRLVGASVTEEIARRRVTADFVVGHDGTPYAVRLVQTRF